jgi:hypothetical protein
VTLETQKTDTPKSTGSGDTHPTLGDGSYLKPNDDITLAAGAGSGENAANPTPQFHPVVDQNTKVFVKASDPENPWKNYKFSAKFDDGTQQEFIFTAKDDADAQAKIKDRVASTVVTKTSPGKFTLSLLDAPEIASGDFASEADKKAADDKTASDKAASDKIAADKAAADAKK